MLFLLPFLCRHDKTVEGCLHCRFACKKWKRYSLLKNRFCWEIEYWTLYPFVDKGSRFFYLLLSEPAPGGKITEGKTGTQSLCIVGKTD